VASLAEMTGSWLDVFLTGLEAVWPLLDKMTRGADALLFVFSEFFSAFMAGAAEVIKLISGWADEWLNLEHVAMTVEQAVFKGLKYIAMGAGYAWDAFKVGAGVVATVCGSIVQSFGAVLDVIADATRKMADLASNLPSALRPDWIGKAADAVAGWKKDVEGVGDAMRKWGADAGAGFGKTANAFGAIIDGLQARFEARSARIARSAHKEGDDVAQSMAEVKLTGAHGEHSKEAYSIVTRFNVGAMMAGNPQKEKKDKALEAQKAGNVLLKQILAALNGKPVVGATDLR
jgi:hypothetical protein